MQKQRKLPSSEVMLWSWSKNAAGAHPIRIRITHNTERKYYPINYNGRKLFLSSDDWTLVQDSNKPLRGELRKVRETIALSRTLAKQSIDNVIKNNKPFTWDGFEKEFLFNESGKEFLSFWKDHLETLREENRTGTYTAYKNAYNAFVDFRKKKDLSAFDITPLILREFETFLQKRGCGKTTQGMYARSLKVIYNLAADKNPALLESYPFARKQTDRNRYKIKTGSGHKGDALSVDQLRKFISIKTDPCFPEHEAKLLWLFSFYCQGMNMKDIFLLKYKNIQGETIKYVRAKTKDTEAKESIMEIALNDRIRTIIGEIGNPNKASNSYVFLVIPNGLASTVKRRTVIEKNHEERLDEIIRQKIKMINYRVKALCQDNDLKEVKLTTYWARHTFASLLKDAGESIEMIRELLGHSDMRTTENYIKRFDLSKKQAVNDRIESILKAS